MNPVWIAFWVGAVLGLAVGVNIVAIIKIWREK